MTSPAPLTREVLDLIRADNHRPNVNATWCVVPDSHGQYHAAWPCWHATVLVTVDAMTDRMRALHDRYAPHDWGTAADCPFGTECQP